MAVLIALILAGLQVDPDPDAPDRAIWPAADQRGLDFAHPARIVDVALAGGRLLALDEEGEVSAWNVDSETLLWRKWIHSRGRQPLKLALSPDGRRAAVAPRAPPSDVVRLLDAETGAELRSFEYGSAPAFSADGSTLGAIVGPWVKRWDLGSGRELELLPPAPAPLGAAALSPEGRRAVAIVLSEPGFYLLDAERRTAERFARPVNDWGLARAVAFSPHGTRLAVADTHALAVWELRDGRPVEVSRLELGMRAPFRFLADGRRLLVRSSHRTWSLLDSKATDPIDAKSGSIGLLSCSEDGEWLIQTEGSLVRLLRREGDRPSPERVLWASWASDDAVLLWHVDGRLERWWPDGRRRDEKTRLPKDPVHALSDDGSRALIREAGRYVVRDLAAGRDLLRVEDGATPKAAALSPDGRRLLAGARFSGFDLWDVDAAESRRMKGEGLPTAAAFSAGGRTLAWADAGGALTFASAKTGAEPLRFGPRGAPATALALAPDGSFAVGGDGTGEVRLWEDRAGVEPRGLTRLRSEVTAVAVSPKGRWVAVGSLSGEIRLLPVLGGGRPVAARGLDREVRRLAFDGEGRWLLATDGTRGPLVWKLPE